MADRDYLGVLKGVKAIPFNVGKSLLADFLCGSPNESIKKNRLDRLQEFGSMAYEKEEVEGIIENLVLNKFLEIKGSNGNKYWKLVHLTQKGAAELENPSFLAKNIEKNIKNIEKPAEISEDDKKVFESFDFLLNKYNDSQKKAIVSASKKILCIAGAGSGKTTVLTKRIELLTTFRSVPAQKILAITFTRKAKREVESRLKHSPFCKGVIIETFNSFSEKMLKKHNNLIYSRSVSVITFGEKVKLVKFALKKLSLSIEKAVNSYFSVVQKKLKSFDELSMIFVHDCFSILDYYKNENKKVEDFSQDASLAVKDQETAKMMYELCIFIDKAMKRLGKRDFSDQVADCTMLFRKYPETIPEFDHVLIDEYQDINSVQIDLVDLLNAENIFAVGDPRQSIFGWRGSKIKYIIEFNEKYPDAEVVALTTNYRSSQPLVELMNRSIKHMSLPNLDSGVLDKKKQISLLKFDSEQKEFEFVIDQVKKSETEKKEVFVLARTNKMLYELAQLFQKQNIDFMLRSDEIKRPALDKENAITLATIHAIKGMEAKEVFVVGCSTQNFPCRTSDHPVIDIIKNGYYDKEEEEKRLFYVAISRAKEKLTLSYTGSPSRFINNDMKKIIGAAHDKSLSGYKEASNSSGDMLLDLKSWRRSIALQNNIPAYMILSDAVLENIVREQPMTLDELEQVKGIGPVKVEKYGEEILRIVNSF